MRTERKPKYIVSLARYAYRGYTIQESLGGSEWYVSRDGINIATCETEDKARATVEVLAQGSPSWWE